MQKKIFKVQFNSKKIACIYCNKKYDIFISNPGLFSLLFMCGPLFNVFSAIVHACPSGTQVLFLLICCS